MPCTDYSLTKENFSYWPNGALNLHYTWFELSITFPDFLPPSILFKWQKLCLFEEWSIWNCAPNIKTMLSEKSSFISTTFGCALFQTCHKKHTLQDNILTDQICLHKVKWDVEGGFAGRGCTCTDLSINSFIYSVFSIHTQFRILNCCWTAFFVEEFFQRCSQFPIEDHVNPRIHHTVKSQQPKQPTHSLNWKNKIEFWNSYRENAVHQIESHVQKPNSIEFVSLKSLVYGHGWLLSSRAYHMS